ncbi:MAG: phosphatase PAP2 family protein [Thalassobaculales bacterium]
MPRPGREGLAWGLLALVVASVAFPQPDLWVSALLWRPEDGFYLRYHPFLQFLRLGVPPILFGGIAYALLLWLAGLAFRQRFLGVDGRVVAYLAGSLAIGPGLLVNVLFKDQWGRARPSTIAEFGGERAFTPAWVMSGQCDDNCSFMSGHAALGFWTVAPALLAPPALRPYAVAAALAFGALMGFARIAQGGHFLSDTIFAAAVSIITALALRAWLRPGQALGAP